MHWINGVQCFPDTKTSHARSSNFSSSTKAPVQKQSSFVKSFPTLEVNFLLIIIKIFKFYMFQRLYNHYEFLDGQTVLQSVTDCRPLHPFCATYISDSSVCYSLINWSTSQRWCSNIWTSSVILKNLFPWLIMWYHLKGCEDFVTRKWDKWRKWPYANSKLLWTHNFWVVNYDLFL